MYILLLSHYCSHYLMQYFMVMYSALIYIEYWTFPHIKCSGVNFEYSTLSLFCLALYCLQLLKKLSHSLIVSCYLDYPGSKSSMTKDTAFGMLILSAICNFIFPQTSISFTLLGAIYKVLCYGVVSITNYTP